MDCLNIICSATYQSVQDFPFPTKAVKSHINTTYYFFIQIELKLFHKMPVYEKDLILANYFGLF